jgi:hypothetical protein
MNATETKIGNVPELLLRKSGGSVAAGRNTAYSPQINA